MFSQTGWCQCWGESALDTATTYSSICEGESFSFRADKGLIYVSNWYYGYTGTEGANDVTISGDAIVSKECAPIICSFYIVTAKPGVGVHRYTFSTEVTCISRGEKDVELSRGSQLRIRTIVLTVTSRRGEVPITSCDNYVPPPIAITGVPAKARKGSTILIPVPQIENITSSGPCGQYKYALSSEAFSSDFSTITVDGFRYFQLIPSQTKTYTIRGYSHCDSREIPVSASFTVEVEPPDIIRRHELQLANSTRTFVNDNPWNFAACADGSETSVFTISGGNIDYLNVFVSIDPQLVVRTEPGLITSQVRSRNAIEVKYRHPGYVEGGSGKVTFNVMMESPYETFLLDSFSVNIRLVPVVMIHGLNSNSEGFKKMEKHLSEANSRFSLPNYNPALLSRVEYGATSRAAFIENENVVPDAIERKIADLAQIGIACGKVDIIGHSMGGLLSRRYLQSADYRNDIHKLITLNTPHAGSPFANWIFDNSDLEGVSIGRGLLNLHLWFICHSGENCDAFSDLRVDSDAIKALNKQGTQPGNLNYHKVPSHAIVTTHTTSLPNSFLDRILLQPAEMVLLGTTFDRIFCQDKSDLIVSKASQQGGLPESATSNPTTDQIHMGSMEDDEVIAQAAMLLNARSTDSRFSQSGFYPDPITYKLCPSPSSRIASGGGSSLRLTSPQAGTTVSGGTKVTITAAGMNLTNIRTLVSYKPDSVYVGQVQGNSSGLSFTIDKQPGKRMIVVLGQTPEGVFVSDSTFIYVSSGSCESRQSGDWSQSQTWSCGHEPTLEDVVVLNPGHVVIVSAASAEANRLIYNGGTLHMSQFSGLRLKGEN